MYNLINPQHGAVTGSFTSFIFYRNDLVFLVEETSDFYYYQIPMPIFVDLFS